MIRSEVLAHLRTNATVPESERAFAIQAAQTEHGNPATLNEAAWKVVSNRALEKADYAQALRLAEAAAEAAPANGHILNTLGVAQYRMGQFKEALATLTQSEKRNASRNGSHPSDLAFLAMTQHGLGQREQAQATLSRLIEIMKKSTWVNNPEAQGYLREAEERINGKPTDGKK
jgi:tetratricopeptide (TPR) repeat protein